MNKQLLIQGALYAVIGALSPILAVLSQNAPIDRKAIITAIISGIISGATSLKAFLSTTFAQSDASDLPKTLASIKHKK